MGDLPIDAVRDPVRSAFAQGHPVLVESPPGSGKTTRVPHWEVERVAPGQVWLLEPRRIAARMAAERLAQQMGARLGGRVGLHMRHERRGGKDTRLWVMTEGIFLRRVLRDPLLEGVQTVLLDEFHERSVQLDLALAFLRDIRETVRPDLGLGILSATLHAAPLLAFLPNALRVQAEGRSHPVSVEHRDGGSADLSEQMSRVVRQVLAETEGDILAFFPGAPSIRRTLKRFEDRPVQGVRVLPLYGELPFEAQAEAVRPSRPHEGRKVVLATNVAESSLTLEGVTTVVDSGLEKRSEFDPVRGIDRLVTRRVARDSAEQRAGRAGRLGPGRAIRVWSEKERLADHAPAEIHRVDLAPVVAHVLHWSETDPVSFGWYEAPALQRIHQAVEQLRDLGLLQRDGFRRTARGRHASRLSLHPRWASFAVRACELNEPQRAAQWAALAQGREVLRDRLESVKVGESADLEVRRKAVFERSRTAPVHPGAAREARRVAEQVERELRALMPDLREDDRSAEDPNRSMQRAILAGFPDRLGRLDPSGRVALASGGYAVLAPTCAVQPPVPWLVALEVDGTGAGPARIRSAVEIDPDLLHELNPRSQVELRFDWNEERVVAEEVVRHRNFELWKKPVSLGGADPAPVLAEAARKALDRALPWSPELEDFVARWRFVHHHLPEAGLPAVPPDVREWLLEDAVQGLHRFAELKRCDLLLLLRGRLGSHWVTVEREAPVRLPIPSGRQVRLRYDQAGPVLSARLQELFTLNRTPTVAGGRVRVRVELLAPNQRPVQVTQDLESFWSRTYPEVRKDLRGRYPKHQWPEDPSQGVPTTRVRPPKSEL